MVPALTSQQPRHGVALGGALECEKLPSPSSPHGEPVLPLVIDGAGNLAVGLGRALLRTARREARTWGLWLSLMFSGCLVGRPTAQISQRAVMSCHV